MSDKLTSQLNAVVTQIIQVSPIMKIFRIAPDGWDVPEFKAGQYIALGTPPSYSRVEGAAPDETEPDPNKMIKRVYSVASSSRSTEYIEFYITLVRSGSLTPRLFDLKIGDKVFLGKKCVGMFTLDQIPQDQNIVLVATGTGVAPYISMLRSNALGERTGKIAVIHGAANSWDLGYSSELTLLSSMTDKLSYLPTILNVEDEPAPWNGDTRFIQDMWADGVVDKAFGYQATPDNTHIFLCGNPNMVQTMEEMLMGQGYKEHKPKEPGQIHAEKW